MLKLKLSKIKIIDIILCMLFIFGIIITASKIIQYEKSKNTMNELKQEINKIYKEENKKLLKEKFSKMKSINNDYFGWISINNTQIDYPIFQYTDNKFYLNHDLNKEYSIAGSIFLDSKNSKNIKENKNTIIYGHNMKNGTMFGELKKLKEEKFLKENNIIKLELEDKVLEYKIFSIYETNPEFNYIRTKFEDSKDFDSFIETIKNKSIYHEDIDLNDKNILTLSTCHGSSNRLAIHAVLIN